MNQFLCGFKKLVAQNEVYLLKTTFLIFCSSLVTLGKPLSEEGIPCLFITVPVIGRGFWILTNQNVSHNGTLLPV